MASSSDPLADFEGGDDFPPPGDEAKMCVYNIPLASFPGLPHFYLNSICVHNITQEQTKTPPFISAICVHNITQEQTKTPPFYLPFAFTIIPVYIVNANRR